MDATCPWCQRDVAFQTVYGPLPRADLPGLLPGTAEMHQVWRCPRAECAGSLYRVGIGRISLPGGWEWEKVNFEWPSAGHREAHQAIPKAVGEDWVEGHLCLGIGAFKAAAAMARRAAQGVCIDRNAKPGKLVGQIKELVATGSLHAQLGEWADQVRLFGNAGAHPGDDGLDTVSREDAEDALAFLDQLLEWTYIAPWKLKQSRARSSKSTNP